MNTPTYGDNLALKILTGEALGLDVSMADEARKQLSGQPIPPTAFTAMERAASSVDEQVTTVEMMAKANSKAASIWQQYKT